jgi:hypothetical protein
MNTFVVNRYNKPTQGATSQTLTFTTTEAGTLQFSAYEENTKVIYLSLIGGGLLMTIDGETPTTTASHRLFAGNSYYFNSDLMKNAKFKVAPGNSATAYLYGSELTN